MGFLAAFTVAFKSLMMYDALRRRTQSFWYMVITVVPFGEWIYFFQVRVHDRDVLQIFGNLLVRRPKLSEMELNARDCPSFSNRLLLASAYVNNHLPVKAIALAEELVRQEPSDDRALHVLGRAYEEAGEFKKTVQLLADRVTATVSALDYELALVLTRAYVQTQQLELAADLLRKIVRTSGRVDHKFELAKVLGRMERFEEAYGLLDEIVRYKATAPRHVRRLHAGTFSEAVKLFRTKKRHLEA